MTKGSLGFFQHIGYMGENLRRNKVSYTERILWQFLPHLVW